MARFEFESGTFWLFYLYSCFNWRIAFACLVVCRWQVRHACSDEDYGRSSRPSAEDQGWWHRSSIQWLRDREVG
jgi:hypothetical protein